MESSQSHRVNRCLRSNRQFLVLLLLFLSPLREMVLCCPDICACLDDGFVYCDGFTERTVQALPTDLKTLVLVRGNVTSLPSSFLKRYPSLSFLEIQSSAVETIVNGTFSGVEGLEQLAIVDCRVGSVETDAFRDVRNVSQVLISGSRIKSLQPGAFSALSNIQELIISSSSVEDVSHGAFKDLSDIGSFTFSHNNVTALATDAFQNVRNLGRVDIFHNNLPGFEASAVIPLTEASSEAHVSSNTMWCQCSGVDIVRPQDMPPFLQSHVCVMPTTGQIFRPSQVNVTELCRNQSTTTVTVTSETVSKSTTLREIIRRSDSGFLLRSSTESGEPARLTSKQRVSTDQLDRTSAAGKAYQTNPQTSTSEKAEHENAAKTELPVWDKFSHESGLTLVTVGGTASRVTSVDVINDVTSTPETVSHLSGRKRIGDLSEKSNNVQNGAIVGKQTSPVFLLVPFIAVHLLKNVRG
ncbi:hypothetical protein ACOMHN_017307 [Nucella lapillus]